MITFPSLHPDAARALGTPDGRSAGRHQQESPLVSPRLPPQRRLSASPEDSGDDTVLPPHADPSVTSGSSLRSALVSGSGSLPSAYNPSSRALAPTAPPSMSVSRGSRSSSSVRRPVVAKASLPPKRATGSLVLPPAPPSSTPARLSSSNSVATEQPTELATSFIEQRLPRLERALSKLVPGGMAHEKLLAQHQRLSAELARRVDGSAEASATLGSTSP